MTKPPAPRPGIKLEQPRDDLGRWTVAIRPPRPRPTPKPPRK